MFKRPYDKVKLNFCFTCDSFFSDREILYTIKFLEARHQLSRQMSVITVKRRFIAKILFINLNKSRIYNFLCNSNQCDRRSVDI